jgi:hypothetical protein
MFIHNYGLQIEKVLKLMETERLDFDLFGDEVIHNARIAKMDGRKKGRIVWVEGDPIHPESPNAVRICGNFERVSAVFSFDTDDSAVIDKFQAAIKKNKQIDHGNAELEGMPEVLLTA